jgi:P-type E1-E2 ATPase
VTHPLAQALAVAAAADPDRPTVHATRFDFRVGFGVTAHIDGERVLVGGRRHLDAAGITIDDRTLASLSESEALGATTLLVATGSGVQGVIALATRPRPEAIGILRFITEHGIERIAMVSGDDDAPSHAVARQLGIEEVHANVLPEGKAELVRRLQREGRRVCFVGDGANDALAMSQADCAISMHGGAELAADAAGILLLEGDLRRLPHLLASARTQQRQLFGLLAYWGGYGVTNIGLNLALRLGVLQSSLVFGTAFGIGLLQTGVPRRRANGDDDAQPNRPAGQPHSSEEPQRDKSRQPPSSGRNPVLP